MIRNGLVGFRIERWSSKINRHPRVEDSVVLIISLNFSWSMFKIYPQGPPFSFLRENKALEHSSSSNPISLQVQPVVLPFAF